MIKNVSFRINTDKRGHISCGVKNAKGYPQGIEGWDISDFPELEEVYGPQPKSLIVYMPSDTLQHCFDAEYSEWGKNDKGSYKKRTCDWEECLHRIDEKVLGQTFAAGEISECLCAKLPADAKKPCAYSAWLNVFVAHPQTREICSLSVYTMRTGSKNAGDAVYNELIKVLGLTRILAGEAKLQGIPFELSVGMISSKEKQSQKFPMWRIQALMFDMSRMLGAGQQEQRPQLSSGNEVADHLANLDADDVEVIEETATSDNADEARREKAKYADARKTAQANGAAKKPATTNPPVTDQPGRAAEEVRAAAKATIGNDAHPRIDGPTSVAVIAALNALTGNTEKRNVAVIAWLFGATEPKELSTAEAEWLLEWIAPKKATDGSWLIKTSTLEEAKLIYKAAARDMAALFATNTDEATRAEADPNEPFPDGLNAYGDAVDPQASLDLGARKPEPNPATM